MKTYKFKTIAFFLAFAAITACSDSYIDVPSNDPNSAEFFNSQEDYEKALIGAYDLLQSTYLNVMVGEIASDNTLAGGESATDTPGIQQIDDMIHTSSNAQLKDIWSWMFAGVNRANYILEFQDKTDFSGKENILGQAKFLRAYYYFELVKWFGDVPLSVDRRIQFGDQFTIERTPKADVYAQIELDLIYAANNLPAVQDLAYKVTKGAAQSLLGKVYLYQDKFTEAADILEDAIAGPYDLVADYNTIFEHDGENGIESVFEVQYTDVEGGSFDCLQCSEGNVAVGFNGIRQYDGPMFDSGFSFNVPTQEVVDEFEAGDLRKDVAILDIEAWNTANGSSSGEGHEHTGYFNRKYIARKGDKNIGDQNLTNPNNYRAIRFADVLLMAAEANNRKAAPDDAKAKTYLNRVRRRAFGVTDASFDVTVSGASLTDAIYHERRVELVGEGHRFFDLVRTGRAFQEIDGFTNGKNELFPIPQIEIELAGNRWDQNPKY
jgi:hypothetical protein